VDSNELLVGCLNATLRLSEVQLEGKKRSSDIDLLNGLKNSQEHFEVNPKRNEV
jgi:Methionyl-tRNA formyltransferase